MKTLPRTITECDKQLVTTHNRYLAAVDCDNIARAAELWIELHDLLDLRIGLHQQRPASE